MKQRDIFARQTRLRQQGYVSYRDYLRSPAWAAVKARYRTSERPQACMCGETEGLDVHHTTYERVGQEELADLVVLCRRCHRMVHVLEVQGELGLDLEGLESEERAATYAEQARQQQVIRDADAQADREAFAQRHWVLRLKELKVEARQKGVLIRDEVRAVRRIQSDKVEDIEKVLARIQSKLDGKPVKRAA